MLNIEDIKKLTPNFKLNLGRLLEDDNLRWPTLASYKIDRDLYVYMETKMLNKYDEPYLAGNHDKSHIYKVLANAIILLEIQFELKTKEYAKELVGKYPETLLHKDQVIEIIEADFTRDMNILYAAVCLHDIGLNVKNTFILLSAMTHKIDNEEEKKLAKEIVEALNNDNKLARKYHQYSGYLLTKYFYRDTLKTFGFIDKEIDIISNAILSHRASDNEHIPDTIIGKILCQADRGFYFTEPYEVFERSFYSQIAKYPNEIDKALDLAVEHVREKNGPNGYAYNKIYFPENSGYINYKKTMISIFSNKEELDKIIMKIKDSISSKDTCGTCENFNPTSITDTELGPIHTCDKNHICEYNNLHAGCEDYKCTENQKENINNIEIKYIDCPNCETKVQYTDQDVYYDDESELDQYGNEIGYEYFEWIICPECGKRIIVDEG